MKRLFMHKVQYMSAIGLNLPPCTKCKLPGQSEFYPGVVLFKCMDLQIQITSKQGVYLLQAT